MSSEGIADNSIIDDKVAVRRCRQLNHHPMLVRARELSEEDGMLRRVSTPTLTCWRLSANRTLYDLYCNNPVRTHRMHPEAIG